MSEFGENVVRMARGMFRGKTITRAEADEAIYYINQCVAPETPKTNLLGVSYTKVIIDTDDYNATEAGTALFWRNSKEWIVSSNAKNLLGGFAGISIRGLTPEFLKVQEEEMDGYSCVFIQTGGFAPLQKATYKI